MGACYCCETRNKVEKMEQNILFPLTDLFYLTNAVTLVLGSITRDELLQLLIVVETGADFRKVLPFADSVQLLFTEFDAVYGGDKPSFMHDQVRCVLRGYCAVKFEFE